MPPRPGSLPPHRRSCPASAPPRPRPPQPRPGPVRLSLAPTPSAFVSPAPNDTARRRCPPLAVRSACRCTALSASAPRRTPPPAPGLAVALTSLHPLLPDSLPPSPPPDGAEEDAEGQVGFLRRGGEALGNFRVEYSNAERRWWLGTYPTADKVVRAYGMTVWHAGRPKADLNFLEIETRSMMEWLVSQGIQMEEMPKKKRPVVVVPKSCIGCTRMRSSSASLNL
ncbi:AP2-containing protein [Hordeum vulgare]|nr:AP2-containing protein [Hordeum vulgare]